MSGYDQPMSHHLRFRENVNSLHGVGDSGETFAAMKASIVAHPQYSNLVQAYIDCQKVVAPPETVDRLVQLRQDLMPPPPTSAASIHDSKDPELDQFMEAYYNMLVKLREKLTTPMQEAMAFIRSVETQLKQLTNPPRTADNSGGGSSDNGHEISHGGDEETRIDPRSKDPKLKNYLRSKYRGHLSTLQQEFSMKKKKGKLPKEARHKLLTWWQLHYKWPYPSESDKVALEEATGLDHKQINNWFINQRKRHWKPSDEGEFMVMDDSHNPHNAPLYMDGHYLGHDGPHRLRH